jgi:deazaflavin-dependent oxidoreductase (nitroreductase family)
MKNEESLPLAIRVLRRLNPLLTALLRSPLHGVLSRDLLLLGYVGARSGRRRELPLSYVELDGATYLCTRTSVWWRNLRAEPRVELCLRGRRVAARATVLDPASPEALAGFRAFVTRNPRTGTALYEVRPGPDRGPLDADVAREVRRSVVVRLDVDRARAA